MTYTTTTLNSASCATDFLTAVDAAMTATDAGTGRAHFTQATNGNPAGLGYLGYVWKSDGNYNHLNGVSGGYDWYVYAYAASAASTAVYFGVCESWDSANKQVKRYVPYVSTTVGIDATYKYSNDAAVMAPSNLDDGAGAVPLNCYVSIQASLAFSYFLNINHHRVFIATRTTTPQDSGLFLGMTENLIDTTISGQEYAAVSLCCANGTTTTTKTINYDPYRYRCGFTREPGQTIAATGNWGAAISTTYFTYPYYPGSETAIDCIYKPAATYYVGQRVPIYSTRDNASLWIPRALMPVGVLQSPRHSSAYNGDTLTVGGTTYYHMTLGNVPSTSHFFVADTHGHA